MTNKFFAGFLVVSLGVFSMAGCATTKTTRSSSPDEDPTILKHQITTLETQVEEKDRQIQDLEYEVESYKQSLSSLSALKESAVTPTTKKVAIKSSSSIRVSGVSVKEVQAALKRAGLNPGSIDGKFGKNTKQAIRDFQRQNSLKADGIVGQKTWALLKLA